MHHKPEQPSVPTPLINGEPGDRLPDGVVCRARPWWSDIGRLIALTRIAAASAALFSMAFVFDGWLAWLGLFGFLPIVLYAAGCPTCSAAGDPRHTTTWPAP